MLAPIAILGGTFDPVHNGHLSIARAAVTCFGLERVIWIPSGDPGHRSPPVASGAYRLALLRLALAGDAHSAIDEFELTSLAPTYTVPTLERLREQFGPTRPIITLSGADSFASLPTWHRWRELFGLTHFAVVERPGTGLEVDRLDPALRPEWEARLATPAVLARSSAGCIVRLPMMPLAVSASAIRYRLARGEAVGDLLPASVLAYIESNRLYH